MPASLKPWFFIILALLPFPLSGAEPILGSLSIPPVATNGFLRSTYRFRESDQGNRIDQITAQAELNANSFIWRPWVATWSARLALGWAGTETNDDELKNMLAAGEGRVKLFPSSRFPLELYLNIRDSRLEGERTAGDFDSGSRDTRFGLIQQYRPLDTGTSYRAQLERISHENLNTGSSNSTDWLQLDATRRRRLYDLYGTISQRKFIQDDTGNESQQLVASGSYNYHPNAELSIDSNAFLSFNHQQIPGVNESRQSEFRANSSLMWRSRQKPLRVRARSRYTARKDELERDAAGEATDRDSQQFELTGSLEYDFNRWLELDLNAGLTRTWDEINRFTAFQRALLIYDPEPIPVAGFSYNWSTSGFLHNRDDNAGEDIRGIGGSFSHNMFRSFPISTLPSLVVSANANQTYQLEYQTRDGTLYGINSNISASLVRNATGMVSTVRASLVDILSYRTTDTHVFVATLQGTHNQALSRFSRWSLDFNLGYNLNTTDSNTSSNVTSNAKVNYFHRRIFDVRGLRLESELEFRSNSYLVFDFGEESSEVSWRNKLFYTIGLLNIDFLTNLRRTGTGQRDMGVFLSVTRYF